MRSTKNYPVASKTRKQPDWVRKEFGSKWKGSVKQDDNFCDLVRKIRDGKASESKLPDLHKYQKFVTQFMRFDSPYRTMLLYHGTGTGKTRTAISVYNSLYNTSPDWNVIILTKGSLKGNWKSELDRYLTKKGKKNRRLGVDFVAYNSANPYTQMVRLIQKMKKEGRQKNMYIIEEAHNFVSQVYGNTRSNQQQALDIYQHIMTEVEQNQTTRVICLTATPIINNPIELTFLFNLLRPNTFSTNPHDFQSTFLTQDSTTLIRRDMINVFQRRIQGLVSYYGGEPKAYYATTKSQYVKLKMSKYMDEIYRHVQNLEATGTSTGSALNRPTRGTIVAVANFRRGQSGMFKGLTRSACNFVFPVIAKSIVNGKIDVSGRNRPRPFQIRKQMREEGKITENDEKRDINKKVSKLYSSLRRQYIQSLRKYFEIVNRADKKNGHTITDDIGSFFKSGHEPLAFVQQSGKRSGLFQCMADCSPKMTVIALSRVLNSKKIGVVYSGMVEMEGLEIFTMYLENIGILKYDAPGQAPYGRYINLNSKSDSTWADRAIKSYINKPENFRGKIVSTVLISPALSEGINLFNVRSVHIMEPYWNENRIIQIIGRGRRLCSHAHLPRDEWHVDVYRYIMIRDEGGLTADEELEAMTQRKKLLVDSFLKPIREVAVDCPLWHDDHIDKDPYRTCFRFSSKQLIERPNAVGYRKYFKEDVEKGAAGSHAPDHEDRKIELKKVRAQTEDGKPEEYWMDMDGGFLYDLQNEYLIGLIERDGDGIFQMVDFDTYFIGKVVMYDHFTSVD